MRKPLSTCSVEWFIAKAARSVVLVLTGIAGGAAYGTIAAVVMLGGERSGGRFGRRVFDLGFGDSEFVFGTMLGTWIGAVSLAYVMPLLWRTDLRKSIPFVALPTFVVAAVTGTMGIVSAAAAVLVNAILCMVAWEVFWVRVTPGEPRCEACGYSLVGLARGGVCPECGKGGGGSDA